MPVNLGTLDQVLDPLTSTHRLDTLNTKGSLFLTYEPSKNCWKTSCIMPTRKERESQQDLVILSICKESLSFLQHTDRVTLALRVNAFYTDKSGYSVVPDENGEIRFNSRVPKYSFLSNFSRTVIVHRGTSLAYPSIESLFSCLMAERCGQAGAIDRHADPVTIKKKWGNIKAQWLSENPEREEHLKGVEIETMRHCVRLKFDQNSNFAELLLETEELPLFEQSTTSKVFGSDRVVDEDGENSESGENALGLILMRRREALRH